MKKSIFLFFAAILCAMSVNAKDIYADMSSAPSWYADAYIHYWDGSSDKYVKLEETGISKLLKATINDNYQGWRVCRYVDGGRHNDCTWISDKNVNKFIVNSNGNGGSSTTIIGLVTGGHIYFDNLETKWTGNIQFVVGHDSYSRTYEMTQISNTHLWYVNLTDKDYHTWGDAKYYGFIASGSKFGDGSWNSSNLKNATSYTKAYTSTYSLNEGAIYYCKMSATANGSTFSIDYKGSKDDIPKHNATQAAKVRNSKTDAYADINGAWPATLKLEGTYLDNNSTAKRSDITSTTSTDDANKRVYGAVRSGKVTHTYANLNEDYHFEGWGTANEPTSTNDSYEYNITANTTVYAFFTKKYPVNFSADANGSVTATADEQALTSGTKVVGGTEVTLTATANPGYEFVNWTKAGEEVSTDASYTFTVTENVDLVANFAKEEYTRTTTIDSYGTICLPFGSDDYTGAEFYEVAYLVEGQGLWLDQLADGVQLEAGKPYIFKATATELVVVSNATEVEDPVDGANGLTGTFSGIVAGGLTGNYIIAENKVWVAGTGATLSANRAYIDASLVPTTAKAQLPGRRRVCMGENAATGLDNITNGENTVIKTIENGQLIIIRNGEKFNAQGVRL